MEDTINNNAEEKPVELTELFKDNKKSVALSDIIVFQAILCVAVSLVYMVMNIFLPESAVEMYEEFTVNYNMEISEEGNVIDALADFINSSPADND